MKRLDFEKTLLEAVDSALLSLGESPRQAVYYHLNKRFKLQREEIPEDASEFSQALNFIFGPGAEVIEKIIVRNLYSSLNLSFEEKTCFQYAESVSLARQLAKRERQRVKTRKRVVVEKCP